MCRQVRWTAARSASSPHRGSTVPAKSTFSLPSWYRRMRQPRASRSTSTPGGMTRRSPRIRSGRLARLAREVTTAASNRSR